MSDIRAFIAAELPAQAKVELRRLVEKLRPGRERAVKWVDPEGIHLTLKFLGNIPEEQAGPIADAIRSAATDMAPFRFEMEHLGGFPNTKSPKVAWVGLAGDLPGIVALQQRIDQLLVPLGFAPETRDFTPHLTLGRVRDRATHKERADLGRGLSAASIRDRGRFTVDRICLMRSTLSPVGAIYDQLATVILDKNAKNMLN